MTGVAGLIVLFGASGSGKTFVALDLAYAIAMGVQWRGNRVKKGRVLSIAVDVGSRVPAHATSMGRVLSAWAPADQVAAVIDAGLPRLAEKTITDSVTFRQSPSSRTDCCRPPSRSGTRTVTSSPRWPTRARWAASRPNASSPRWCH